MIDILELVPEIQDWLSVTLPPKVGGHFLGPLSGRPIARGATAEIMPLSAPRPTTQPYPILPSSSHRCSRGRRFFISTLIAEP